MFKRKNNRLSNYDYSSLNYYFVTICTQNKKQDFGEILDCKMALNTVGQTVEMFWKEIPQHYPGVELDEFIVMPNHLHGIVIIGSVEEAIGLHKSPTGLSTIIGSFKNITSKIIHKSENPDFCWQKSFYDNVIRKDGSLDKIREYIKNNPLKWELDRNNPENLWM